MGRFECAWPDAPVKYEQFINYPRIVMWSEPDFDFEVSLLQIAPGKMMTFVHIYVYYWAPSTFKKLKHLWSSNRINLPPIVYAQGDLTDDKWVRFVKSLGFQPLLADVPCTDGKFRHIYVHFKCQQKLA